MQRAEIQLSLKDMFVFITLLCVVLAGLGTSMELRREALLRSECLPGLRGGDPYWSTPEGQRAVAAYRQWREMSDAERTRIEKTRRLRVNVGLFSFSLVASSIIAWLAVRLVVFLKLQWRTPRETAMATPTTSSETFTAIR